MAKMSKHEAEQVEKQIAQFEKLASRSLVQDAFVWFMFSAIVIGGTNMLLNYKDTDITSTPYLIKLAAFILIGTAVMVPLTRWFNKKSLEKLKRKLEEHKRG